MKPENPTNLGGAPGGLGGTTGVDPRSGHRRGPGEERSFEPGPDSTGGQIENTERGDGQGPGPTSGATSERDAETRGFASAQPGQVPRGGEGGGAMSGRGQARGPDLAADTGDAPLGEDAAKLGDPMNAKRQATSDENSDLSNGSGAD